MPRNAHKTLEAWQLSLLRSSKNSSTDTFKQISASVSFAIDSASILALTIYSIRLKKHPSNVELVLDDLVQDEQLQSGEETSTRSNSTQTVADSAKVPDNINIKSKPPGEALAKQKKMKAELDSIPAKNRGLTDMLQA